MRINELTLPTSRYKAERVLLGAGYHKLGSGAFGSVYSKDGRPYVLKLFTAEDRAYRAFMAMVKQNPNPHFPKTIGKMVEVTDDYYAIRLEPLLPAGRKMGATKFVEQCVTYLVYFDFEVENALKHDVEPLRNARAYMDQNPDLKHACDLIHRLLENKWIRLDVAIKNTMVRGDTFVFTDPVFCNDYLE